MMTDPAAAAAVAGPVAAGASSGDPLEVPAVSGGAGPADGTLQPVSQNIVPNFAGKQCPTIDASSGEQCTGRVYGR